MIILKCSKKDSLKFISHIELLRHMARIIRRADIPIKFSQGFNPHPLMFFSPPIVLGVNSSCEYIALDSPMDKNEVLKRYNSVVPEGMKASKSFCVLKNPNLAYKIEQSDYLLNTQFEGICFSDACVVSYKKKGEIVSEDIASKIFGYYPKDDKLVLRLATGAKNLRVDRVIEHINDEFSRNVELSEIEKFCQYVIVDGKTVDVDSFLESIECDIN